ncbi:uncharacterized protein LY89DRAFT_608035 [Mollisia scopiformis]|uniref:Amino acid transporter n=1 Tax=Mollisia scopiformis TaxID=149040 RepID=A0A194XNC3_MOLSC|nr:uncharacterized protein LY89DRAFT_608035 [Mollisia scopiformis]KUJ21641.1 hypothetical protein LY89DRAFT_608035 [Mollisia scopiformis]
MGYYSTVCLIFNRMIGTGIFNSGQIVFANTQSIGISLILWVLGAVLALAGVIVYVELGLTIPRWPSGANGEKISTPRSGEALNYFNYYLKRPLFLATCLFGIPFIVLENTAANSVSFAQNILDACEVTETPGAIIGIALAANTCACLLHAISRKWGIILNNAFGTIKFFILLFIVIVGLVWINKGVARDNYDIKTSFSTTNSPKAPYPWAEAFLFIIYPYGAFHQINYVISELHEPRKTFPRASWWGVLTVAVLYTSVQMIFAAIIPKADLFVPGGIDVGSKFFLLTLGTKMKASHVKTFFSILKAISAFGNIIVVTFTCARVKQEIAKEGILPYSLWFAESYDFSLDRIFRGSKSRPKAEVNSMLSEKTPAGALALHWLFTTIMVIVPVMIIKTDKGYSATAAQTFLAGIFAYVIDVCCFVCISFGLLCLRFTPSVRWSEKSELRSSATSITAALILFCCSLFPFICIWIPDPNDRYLARSGKLVSWFASQTAGLALITIAFIYWVIFRIYVKVRSSREGKTLHIRREPKFKQDSHGLTQILEIVTIQWKRDVDLRLDEIEETDDGYRSSTLLSGSTARNNRRLQDFGARDRLSPLSGSSGVHEMAQHNYSVRRKPVMSEMP